ncbi:MAG: hypothetical protein HKL86_09475 [Acidimicrobiaceae bacterium]|nr:hypothetical protein [Acidimicrobiaceae bacterium]
MTRHRRCVSLLLVVGVLASAGISEGAFATNLVQTTVKPSSGAPLTKMMRELFAAISSDSVGRANSLFFPRAAYVWMKTGEISNPGADFDGRLLAFYRLDLQAYHQRLASHPTTVFVRVNVNARLANWIPPGTCENRVGYWHLPGVRLVLRSGHRIESVAIDSLISWRGAWYVVHLGPNPRPRNVGTVDSFALGPGIAGPGGGC